VAWFAILINWMCLYCITFGLSVRLHVLRAPIPVKKPKATSHWQPSNQWEASLKWKHQHVTRPSTTESRKCEKVLDTFEVILNVSSVGQQCPSGRCAWAVAFCGVCRKNERPTMQNAACFQGEKSRRVKVKQKGRNQNVCIFFLFSLARSLALTWRQGSSSRPFDILVVSVGPVKLAIDPCAYLCDSF
jgi:hypothetical protein